jgi:hypothetical protein
MINEIKQDVTEAVGGEGLDEPEVGQLLEQVHRARVQQPVDPHVVQELLPVRPVHKVPRHRHRIL